MLLSLRTPISTQFHEILGRYKRKELKTVDIGINIVEYMQDGEGDMHTLSRGRRGRKLIVTVASRFYLLSRLRVKD